MRKPEAFPGTFVFHMKAPVKKYSLKRYTPRLSKDIAERMKELSKADQESVWLIGYDWHDTEIYHECIGLGSTNEVMVDLGIIFKRLFTMEVWKFVLVHNHPGAECAPSTRDIELTEKLFKASRALNILFLEHLIIGEDGFFSFRAEGALKW